MDIKIPVQADNKFKKMVELLGVYIHPFNKLRMQEINVLSEFYTFNHTYKDIPENQRNILMFHSDNKKVIAEKLGVSMDNIYNIVLSLRKKGFILKGSLNPKYLIKDISNINFIFVDEPIQ